MLRCPDAGRLRERFAALSLAAFARPSAPTVCSQFRMLGVPELMRADRAGNVALANAVCTGVANDKAVPVLCDRRKRDLGASVRVSGD
jgi:hypothetical protein